MRSYYVRTCHLRGNAAHVAGTFPFGKDANLIDCRCRNSKRPLAQRPALARFALRTAPMIAWLLFACWQSPAQQSLAAEPPIEDSSVQPAQFSQTVPPPTLAQPPGQVGLRSVQVHPRSELGFHGSVQQTPEGESIAVISGGVNVVVQGLDVNGMPSVFGPLGNIDIETDRAVIWTRGMTGLGQFTQSDELPLQIYMEGNIVFRQGDRTIYADRMFYDVRSKVGVILNAELLTPLPAVGNYEYQGLVRLKAAVLRQLSDSQFVAHNAILTTSRLEEPSYHLHSDTITFQDSQQPGIDPLTGQPVIAHQRLAQSQGNYLYLGGVPVFYWPTIATDLNKPTYYIDSFRVRSDSIFGTQALLELDAYQVFGIPAVAGSEWDLNLDILSERGVGFGTTFEYGRNGLFGTAGPANGLADAWFLKDDGVDNLGFGRRAIVPEEDFRGRLFWNHQQRLVGGVLDGWTVQAEVGYITDRTFLEQYFENEWDTRKDQTTGVRLKRTFDNKSLSVEANARVNDFFTQTQWLPRGDFYWLGESLLDNMFTLYDHSQAGFANIGVASTPTNPVLAGQFDNFPWEETAAGNISGKGERLVTRNEIDLPLDLAPFKVVPYVLGEAAHWGEDIAGNDIQRLYYQAGVRASVPMWNVYPGVRDPLFNLNGLAHKVVFEAEAFYAKANRNMSQFPQYDELDDDSIEELRRRLFFPPFGGNLSPGFFTSGAPSTINPRMDPRFYALRSGYLTTVTSPATEILDDLTLVRLGMRHRLQTKRGAPGQQRIVDWLMLDTHATFFPNENRDNFGQEIGYLDYDFRWHIGDRFSVLSDGAADVFGNGTRTAAAGVLLNRPSRGNAYLGYRKIEGPNDADVITGTINYRSSPKWVMSGSTTFDLSDNGNIGQSFLVSRIGESLISTFGIRVDESKGNVGASFLIEPRFLPRSSLTRRTGIEIPPAGAFGLE